MKTRRIAACAVAALAVVTLQAQEADPVDETPAVTTTVEERIVVTADRLEKSPREVGSSVTVITAEEIELKRKSSVAELLRSVPGVEVVRGGGPGQVTSVFIRGGNSSHTLVLLDGVRVNGPTTGAFDFANLAADQVERIEVVRGPQSTLYGSEAVAGVISIFSKAGAEGLRFSGLAEAGELGTTRFRAGVSGGRDRFDYAVTVSDEQTDGVSSASKRAGNREQDPYENLTATARLGFGFSDEGEVNLSLRYFDSEVANDGFDFLLGPVDDLNRIQTRDGLTASLTVREQFGPRWRQSFVLGWNDEELAGIDPDDTFSNFTVENRSFEITSQSDVSLAENDVLTLGFAYDEREGGSVGNFDEKVDILSAFVQNVWSWEDRFHLTAGARHDDHSHFGGETTYRLSTTWSLGSGTRLHGTYGTGFKAPTLNDLFFPFFSNPDLKPETSESYDFGVEQSWGEDRWSLDVTWFDTDFEDLIAFSFVTFTPQNTAEATSSGLEVTFEYRPGPSFHLAGSHTINDTEDRATGLQLARRPENRSTLDLYFRPHPRLSGSASLIVASDRIDSDGSEMDDYERLDLSLSYRLREGVEPYLRVENLLDDEYEEVRGFTSPGSVVVVGLGLKY
ncbi:MAG: TonB-dependent receptor [bacterium]|nr:TonB-dependent receptor [bacterium]